MRVELRPSSADSSHFTYKEPPQPPPDRSPPPPPAGGVGPDEKEAPQVRPKLPERFNRFVQKHAKDIATGLGVGYLRTHDAPDYPSESLGATVEEAREYEAPASMPGPAAAPIPPAEMSMPAPMASPNYAAMSADANMGLYDLIRQSQAQPPNTDEAETHDPYIHGGA